MRLTALLLLLPGIAFACPILDHADPRVGSTVESADHVTLYFSGKVDGAKSTIRVADAAGHDRAKGAAYNIDENTYATATAPLAPGKYKVTWNADCGCGQPMPGTYRFTVK